MVLKGCPFPPERADDEEYDDDVDGDDSEDSWKNTDIKFTKFILD